MKSLLRAVASVLSFAASAQAGTLVVKSGESIRAALGRAHAGDTVEILPGIYREGSPTDLNALTVTTSDIHLIGRGNPVLENAGRQGYGIWVSPPDSAGPGPEANDEAPPCGTSGAGLSGFSIEGITIRGFTQHGVHLACVNGFSIEGVTAEANGVYGLFPVLSRNGRIVGNTVRGTSHDAGIYVGQSDRVLIAGNRSEDNLLGLEVEDSRDCAVVGNELRGNTLGIIVDVLNGKLRFTQERTLVAFNNVHDNNRANTASPDDIIAVLPPGIGILLSGADTTTVISNDVRGNQFAGIGVASLCLGFALQGDPEACAGVDVDPNPDGNRISGNVVLNNGTAPTGTPLDALLGDLVWDGSGAANCWSDNRFGSSVPSPLLACP